MEKFDCKADFEYAMIEKIIEGERLYGNKARVYSKLLTDMALAEQMEEIATAREESKQGWIALLTGKESEKEEQE